MENNNLTIDRKLASRLSAIGVIVSFLLFATGYFVGKRHATSDFLNRLKKESLTDQVYSSVSSLYEPSSQKDKVLLDRQGTVEESDDLNISNVDSSSIEEAQPESPLYYAQLASFRRMQDATPLVRRLQKHGISTDIKEITSKSKQGRTIKWFQVTTTSYKDKDDLDALIKIIKKIEKINDIVIKKENKS